MSNISIVTLNVLGFIVSNAIIVIWIYYIFSKLYNREILYMSSYIDGKEKKLLRDSFEIISNLNLINDKIENKDEFIEKFEKINKLLADFQKNYKFVSSEKNFEILQIVSSLSTKFINERLLLLKKIDFKIERIEKALPLLEKFNSLNFDKILKSYGEYSETFQENDDKKIQKTIEIIDSKMIQFESLKDKHRKYQKSHKDIVQYYKSNLKELETLSKKFKHFIELNKKNIDYYEYIKKNKHIFAWRKFLNIPLIVLFFILSVTILLTVYIYSNNKSYQIQNELKSDILHEVNILINDRISEMKDIQHETKKISNFMELQRKEFIKKLKGNAKDN